MSSLYQKFSPLLQSDFSLHLEEHRRFDPNPDDILEVTILLKGKGRLLKHDLEQRLSHEELYAKHNINHFHIDVVSKFALHHNLSVVRTSMEQRLIVVSGSIANLEVAFGTKLVHITTMKEDYISPEGYVQVPDEIHDFVLDVIGLNTINLIRPKANQVVRLRANTDLDHIKPNDINDATNENDGYGYTGAQIAKMYNFPDSDGEDMTVGIIELGGGFSDDDIDTYFTEIGLSRPVVLSHSVAGVTNSPGGKYDGEVMLDVLVLGAVVPKCKQVVYFGPNSTSGFMQTLQAAIHDTTNNPSVISISWGQAEKYWSASNIQAFESVLSDAAALGITICVSSGDNGSTDGGKGLNVQYPSSSPLSLSCGGTTITVTGEDITDEVVWGNWAGSTGGGFSNQFDVPKYQKGVVPTSVINPQEYRGVPDVAGSADAFEGYYVIVDGRKEEKGGTSAVAPLYAGLVIRMNKLLSKRLGFINPQLYAMNNTSAFKQILSGSNGDYNAGPIWNACTGLGAPNGKEILNRLSSN